MSAKKKRSRGQVLATVKENMLNYSQCTPLLAVPFIGEPGRPYTERIIWAILFIVSVIFCVVTIYPVYDRWLNDPTMTTIDDLNYPISEIAFPAVTICPNIRFLLERFIKAIKNEPWKSTNQSKFFLLSVVNRYAYTEQRSNFDDLLPEVTSFIEDYHKYIPETLLDIMQPCENLIVACFWQGIQVENYIDWSYRTYGNPQRFYNKMKVYDYYDFYDYGNYDYRISVKEDPLAIDYSNLEVPTDTESLFKTNFAGSDFGLSVMLNSRIEDYQLGLGSNIYFGCKILVHSPNSFPEVDSKGLALGIFDQAFIGVSARYTESTDAVKGMSFQRRKCLLPDDDITKISPKIRLDTFQNYSRISCTLECTARTIMKDCNCLPYYYPDFSQMWNKSTDCGFEGLKCIAENFVKHRTIHSYENEASIPPGQEDSCFCPRDCDEIVYFPEINYANFIIHENSLYQNLIQKGGYLYPYTEKINQLLADGSNVSISLAKKFKLKRENLGVTILRRISMAHIYFKELGIEKYTTDEIYSIIDLIAAIGGTVGLFIGFSLLNVFEFIYFFPMRIITDLRRRNIQPTTT